MKNQNEINSMIFWISKLTKIITFNTEFVFRRRIFDWKGESVIDDFKLVKNEPLIVANFEGYETHPAPTLLEIIQKIKEVHSELVKKSDLIENSLDPQISSITTFDEEESISIEVNITTEFSNKIVTQCIGFGSFMEEAYLAALVGLCEKKTLNKK